MKKMNKGFTLVELIIVIAILAIIMLIAIPNFSGIQQRMQVRADKATAAQIGKAVRVWYTDTMADKALKTARAASITAMTATAGEGEDATTAPVVYDQLIGFDSYMASGSYSKSLRSDKTGQVGQAVTNQGFGILLSGGSSGAKFVVAIGELSADKKSWLTTPANVASNTITGAKSDDGEAIYTYTADYDGSKPAVAYIEP